MTRNNNIVLSYLIVKKFNDELKRGLTPVLLINYIIRRTGVTQDKAREYMSILENGITIEGKVYKIEYTDGGYYAR